MARIYTASLYKRLEQMEEKNKPVDNYLPVRVLDPDTGQVVSESPEDYRRLLTRKEYTFDPSCEGTDP
jgi:hypothetical protein